MNRMRMTWLLFRGSVSSFSCSSVCVIGSHGLFPLALEHTRSDPCESESHSQADRVSGAADRRHLLEMCLRTGDEQCVSSGMVRNGGEGTACPQHCAETSCSQQVRGLADCSSA